MNTSCTYFTLHFWRYNAGYSLVFIIICLHVFLSLDASLNFLILILFRSSSTSCNQHFLHLPFLFGPCITPPNIFLDILFFSFSLLDKPTYSKRLVSHYILIFHKNFKFSIFFLGHHTFPSYTGRLLDYSKKHSDHCSGELIYHIYITYI